MRLPFLRCGEGRKCGMMNTNLLGDDVVGTIYLADNIDVLRTLQSESVDLIYIDPPFNTGKVQERTQLRTVRSEQR
jgi:site-specific DNA-methyltransferase (adenine-specific)